MTGRTSRKLIVGCGYLGRRVAAAWRRNGDEVFALTRSAEHADELRAAGIEPVVGDVTDPSTLSRLPDADTLLFAVGFDRSAGHSQRAVYVDGLSNVLEETHQRVQRIVHVSSTSVYGQQQGEWIDEASPTLPVTPGGEVCLAAEGVVWKFFPASKPPAAQTAVVLRLSGIYGPGRLLRRIEAVRSQTPIAANPQGWLNLIHVDDAVAAVLAAEARAVHGTTCLVSDNRSVTRREYYQRLAELVGAEPPVFEPPDESGEPGSLGKRCRNRRLREVLGVDLQYPTIETGLPQSLK